MTRRQISHRAHDATHRLLMLAERNAPKGLKAKRALAVKAYITKRLVEEYVAARKSAPHPAPTA